MGVNSKKKEFSPQPSPENNNLFYTFKAVGFR